MSANETGEARPTAEAIIKACVAQTLDQIAGDIEEFRREMAAARTIAAEFFTPDEQAEMEAEDQRYAQADEAARKANGYSEEMWGRLDDSYRFDLVMQHYPEVP